MSCEESYLAIRRYLTDEREPYAPGTHGNTKRKIRKAAACYVVRNGTLYYQRRQKGLDEFTELEVVLQDGRRKELIDECHIVAGGEHLNQHQTWESISRKYWWRGILKQVKDYMRQCSQCQSRPDRRGLSDDGTEGNEEMDFGASTHHKSRSQKTVAKHELVFVDSKGIVKQFLPRHGQTMLDKLNQQRLSNQFCDITLLIEGEEHRAHKAVLAACSDYFNELFIEKGAVSSHEAVVDLSGFSKASFLPLLEFAYTSNLSFNFCVMADVATLARHLLMAEVLQICESVHKKVEEQKLMVYQRGDIHTVVSSQPAPQPGLNPDDSGAYIMTIQSDGQAVVTGLAGEDPPSQDQVPESAPQPEASSAPNAEARPSLVPQPPKRKRGRPAKVKQEVVEEPEQPVEQEVPETLPVPSEEVQGEGEMQGAHDPYKRRLRQRSMGEGGYVRLHMGLEEDSEDKRDPQIQQKRGRPAKRPVEEAEVATASHVCSQCGLSFHRRYALIVHMLKHEQNRGYKCSICDKDFQYAASLRAHLARHKRQKVQRPALVRAPQGRGEGAPDVDSRTKGRTKREFVCDICGKTLPKLYSLRIHMLNHTGVRPHSCRVCGKTFAHRHSLKMHRALHDNTKQFTCLLCNKSFVSKRSLEEHTSIHTGEAKYQCPQCGSMFNRASGLSKHLKRHQPRPEVRGFPCDHCEKSFFEAKDLQQHMNKHLGLKPFQCQVCGKCYSWKKDWYSHVKSHSVAEPYKCNVCGKEFFEKALFRRHVKKATHGKKGRVKQNLERECEHCNRKFTQLREYRRHMNNHQGVKPFECLTCGVAWADARSLKRHVRTHTGERPYVCPECQEAHIDARSLRKHMAKYHGDHLPGKIMLEKDTLQFHNQGTQVEHAVSILASDLPPELRPAQPALAEEIETVLITEETVEAVQAVQAAQGEGVTTLSDQSIMQVVNYVLSQQGGAVKMPEEEEEEEVTLGQDVIQTMEVEVEHVAEEE
uniref:Zinc finger and BTB domain containing 11 n=1 Tax=Esox lucius TaxID=8010 RepID=A0AAY5K008_ESOLU